MRALLRSFNLWYSKRVRLSLENAFLQEVWERLQLPDSELKELGFTNRAQLSDVLLKADALTRALKLVDHKGSHVVSLTVGAILREAADGGIQAKELCEVHKEAKYALDGIMHAILEGGSAHRMPETNTTQ